MGERDAPGGGGGGGGRDGTFTLGGGGVSFGCGNEVAWVTCGDAPLLEGGAGGLEGGDEGPACGEARGGSDGAFDVFARGGCTPEPAALFPGEDGFLDDGGGGDCDLDPMCSCYQGILNLRPLRRHQAINFAE